jgi:uncharacterized membrane protein YgdD (TMEM256/DUF423 family)
MRLRMKVWLVVASLNGALAVALGAVAVHALQGKLDAHAMSLFETAARYHMYHALALGLSALAMQGAAINRARWSAWLFLIGIVLFSGSLYLYAVTATHWLVFVTPFGGIAFIAGWVLLALAGMRIKAS